MFRCGSPGSSRPWRGFPIRTPWDHSPVIDSPRLIADSYVLLRLLMPRHPPCALKNLTTKDQGVIFERTTETTPSPQQHPERHHHSNSTDPGSYSWKLLLIKDARVHYVVLKQQPRTTHPTHTTCMIGAARKPETQVPEPPRPKPQQPGPVASGPNSVPNTKPPITSPAPFQDHPHFQRKHRGPYWVPAKNRRPLFVDIPPVSTRRRTIVCATGVLLTTPPHPHTRGKVVVGAP